MSAKGSGKGCLEGEEEYKVYDPETGNLITDIDQFDDDVLWELKETFYADDDWILKNIDGKFKKYLLARAQLPQCCYANAPIGFRYTHANIDPRFRAAVEARVQYLREKYPHEDIRVRWDH